VANVPFILLMFFSGAIYPFPKVEVFEVGTRTVGLWDILPPTHAVVALNKILSLGSGLSDVIYELVSLLVLSVVYFAVGVFLLTRTHLRPA
jgi:ABC-2 type transport system permease protein